MRVFDSSAAQRFDGGSSRVTAPAAAGLNLTGDLTLDRYIGVAAVVGLSFIATAAILGRTITDRHGKAPNGEQFPPDGTQVGE